MTPAALDKAIEQIGAERVAAFFCEPVIGAGGVYPPPEDYLARVRDICRQHDVLFIADEVITGFGRTGRWLASERFELEPGPDHHGQGPQLRVRADRRGDRGRAGGRAVLAARVGRGVPARLHVLRAPDRVRGGRRQPRPDRAGAAGQPGGRSWSRCWPPRSGRWPLTRWWPRSGPGTGLLGRGRDRRGGPDRRSRARPAAWSPRSASAGVITRLLRGVALQVSPPFVITEAEIEPDRRGLRRRPRRGGLGQRP